jgi:hypothetical protein
LSRSLMPKGAALASASSPSVHPGIGKFNASKKIIWDHQWLVENWLLPPSWINWPNFV